MADNDSSLVPRPSPEQRRIAAAQFERANQVISSGNFDYGIQLLLTCCKLDTANLIYRQALRRTEKAKYKNNLRGSRLALLTTSRAKLRLKAAKTSRDYLKVLEHGEEVLVRNPWDLGTQMDMAEAADALGLLDLAIWSLDQARQADPNHVTLNRTLARLFEKRGDFAHAIALWELVRRADPTDLEAQHKAKDLAASDTIARGHFEEALTGQATVRQNGNHQPATGELEEDPAIPARVAREAAPIRKRIEAHPEDPSHYLQLAALYRRDRLIEPARAVLQRGLPPTGNNFLLSVELADVEIDPFRHNLALTEEKLRTEPHNEELRRIRIRLLKEINTRELELYRQKADRFPNELSQRLELGVRLLRAGQHDQAIIELQAARNDPRQGWRAYLYLGHSFKQRNLWKLARRNFEEALLHVPPSEENARKEVLFQLAQGCADAGDLAAAIDLATELANLDFGYRDINRLLEEWQSRLQQA